MSNPTKDANSAAIFVVDIENVLFSFVTDI